MKKITLRRLGEVLGLEDRTLRYVVEAGLVPGIAAINRGRGSRRELTPDQAVLVATATMFYARGIRGKVLQELLREVQRCRKGGRVTISLAQAPVVVTLSVSGLDRLRKQLSSEASLCSL